MYSYDETNRKEYPHGKESGEIFTRCSYSVLIPIQPKPDAMQKTRQMFPQAIFGYEFFTTPTFAA